MNSYTIVTKDSDPEVIARRIAVVDMLRGIMLIFLTLGCVLVGFHQTARLRLESPPVMVTLTHYLADLGALGMVVVMGMSLFFFRKYHFSGEKYSVFVATLVILAVYRVFFSHFSEVISPSFSLVFWSLSFVALFGMGWMLGTLLQNRLLLDADDYATYMTRKHDFRKVMLVFGQSPLFFFSAMLFFTQLLAWLTAFSAGFRWNDIDFTAGFWGLPVAFGYQWPRVYLICFCVLGILYPLCKVYGQFKASHGYGWLKYL